MSGCEGGIVPLLNKLAKGTFVLRYKLFFLPFYLVLNAAAEPDNIAPFLSGTWMFADNYQSTIQFQNDGVFHVDNDTGGYQGAFRLMPPNTLRMALERGFPSKDSCVYLRTGYSEAGGNYEGLIFYSAVGIVGNGKSFQGKYRNIIPEEKRCRDDDVLFSQPEFDSLGKKITFRIPGDSAVFGFQFNSANNQLSLIDPRGFTDIWYVHFNTDTVFIERHDESVAYLRTKTSIVHPRNLKVVSKAGATGIRIFNLLGRRVPSKINLPSRRG